MNLWTLRHRLVTIFSLPYMCVYAGFRFFFYLIFFSVCFVVAALTPLSLSFSYPFPMLQSSYFSHFFDIWISFWILFFQWFHEALSVAPFSFVILIILFYQRTFVVIKQNGPTEKHTHKIETMKAKHKKKPKIKSMIILNLCLLGDL